MKSLISLFALLSLTLIAAAQPPDTLWTRTFGGGGDDDGRSVKQTSDGGYIIAGFTTSFGAGGTDIYLVKTDATGNQVWQRNFGGSGLDYSYSVEQTSDGGYVITGYTNSHGTGYSHHDVYLIKTDIVGNLNWQHSYSFDRNRDDEGFDVQQTSDGGYIIAGYTCIYTGNDRDVYLIKTDPAGNLIWQQSFGGIYNDWAYSVQQTSDGGYIIAGTTEHLGNGELKVYLIKTDAEGNSVWQQIYGGSYFNWGYSVQQTSDGGYIIAGYSDFYGAGSYDVYLIKTDANGNDDWHQFFGGDLDDIGYSVQQTSDDGYIITGYTYSYGESWDISLIKTNAAGNLVWQRTFGGDNNDFGYNVQQTTDGGYVIAGSTQSYGAGYYDVYLIKTAADGTPVKPWGEPTSPPAQFALLGAFPNPFNPTTTIRFDLPQAAQVTLGVFDVQGRLVGQPSVAVSANGRQGRLPHQEWYPAGTHEIVFDGSGLPSGVYLYRLTATPSGSGTTPAIVSGKMVLLK